MLVNDTDNMVTKGERPVSDLSLFSIYRFRRELTQLNYLLDDSRRTDTRLKFEEDRSFKRFKNLNACDCSQCREKKITYRASYEAVLLQVLWNLADVHEKYQKDQSNTNLVQAMVRVSNDLKELMDHSSSNKQLLEIKDSWTYSLAICLSRYLKAMPSEFYSDLDKTIQFGIAPMKTDNIVDDLDSKISKSTFPEPVNDEIHNNLRNDHISPAQLNADAKKLFNKLYVDHQSYRQKVSNARLLQCITFGLVVPVISFITSLIASTVFLTCIAIAGLKGLMVAAVMISLFCIFATFVGGLIALKCNKLALEPSDKRVSDNKKLYSALVTDITDECTGQKGFEKLATVEDLLKPIESQIKSERLTESRFMFMARKLSSARPWEVCEVISYQRPSTLSLS